MKFAASVSLTALALAGCAAGPSATQYPAGSAGEALVSAEAAVEANNQGRTPEGAREFVAMVEKDLFDLSVIGGRAGWVNDSGTPVKGQEGYSRALR